MNSKMIKEAIKEANKNSINDYQDGGPFGAIIEKDGKIIARGHNTVLKSIDPTAHAEINAIREASKILNTNDLSGYTLYTNAEPCPMCLSAIIWSNIKTVYYANTKEEAEQIGFRDDVIYKFIKSNNTDKNILNITRIKDDEAIKTFENFKNNKNKKMY